MGSLGIPDGVLRRATTMARQFDADAAELLTGRAALRGLTPNGRISAGGATRLLPAVDGWCALTLSREDDITAVPALLEADGVGEVWADIARWAAARRAEDVVARARLLGLPAARLGETHAAEPRVRRCGLPGEREDVLVADLTSMWAGPLCAQLLGRIGATVVKVESPTRPDGTRRGDPAFFDWMNSGKLSYAIDFDRDRKKLARLLAAADVVLEGSRPAALARRDLGPCDTTGRPGRVWVRITGYGTDPDRADRVAFGDDAAVAGGLVGYDRGTPEFIGDAIADPLTGLAAAAAARASLQRGGGELIEVAMAEVAAAYAAIPAPATDAAPKRPVIAGAAPELGADNAFVEQLVGKRC